MCVCVCVCVCACARTCVNTHLCVCVYVCYGAVVCAVDLQPKLAGFFSLSLSPGLLPTAKCLCLNTGMWCEKKGKIRNCHRLKAVTASTFQICGHIDQLYQPCVCVWVCMYSHACVRPCVCVCVRASVRAYVHARYCTQHQSPVRGMWLIIIYHSTIMML